MACRIGINGFGRIGRMVLRRSLEVPDVEVVAIPPPRHTRTKKALRKQARPLAIKDKTLKEAVELFEKASGTPLCVRWEALEAIAVYRKTEVTVDLPAAPAEQTLRRLLAAIKAPKPLDFGVCGEDVVVSTKAEVAALPIGRVYDIRPILSRVANYGQRTPDNWPDWYEWPPSEGVFGGSRGGIFDEDTTGGADGPSVVPMAVSVIADDDPTAEIDYAGVVEILKKDKVSYKPVGGSAAPDDGVFREDGFDDDKYWPQRRPYPDEGQVFTMLTSYLYRSIGLKREPFSSIGVMGRDGPTGLIFGVKSH